MKYRLLLPVLLALCGCRSNLYYQEQAVESARKFIYKNARELTAEQFAFVRLTPPVLLTGPILGDNSKNRTLFSLEAVSGEEKLQICVVWRIPEKETDYLVFGMSEPRMQFWRPLKLIRRRIGKVDTLALAAMNKSREYAVTSLYEQLSSAELNRVRFAYPELIQTSFVLEKAMDLSENEKSHRDAAPRPWTKVELPAEIKEDTVQLSLCWQLPDGRCVVFCGAGKEDIGQWQIRMAGVVDQSEMKSVTVKKLRSPERFLIADRKKSAPANIETAPESKTAPGKKNGNENKEKKSAGDK